MENPTKMDDFGGTTIFGNTHLWLVNLPPPQPTLPPQIKV